MATMQHNLIVMLCVMSISLALEPCRYHTTLEQCFPNYSSGPLVHINREISGEVSRIMTGDDKRYYLNLLNFLFIKLLVQQ